MILLSLNVLYLLSSIWFYTQIIPIICPSELYEAGICFAPWYLWLEETLLCLFMIAGTLLNYYFVAKYLTTLQLKNLTRLLLFFTLVWLSYLMIFHRFHFIYQAISVLIVLLFKVYKIERCHKIINPN